MTKKLKGWAGLTEEGRQLGIARAKKARRDLVLERIGMGHGLWGDCPHFKALGQWLYEKECARDQ